MEGTCIWFGPTYGYIGYGIYMNSNYEGQVYAHYKNIIRKGLVNPKYRDLKPGDVCEFEFGDGFFNNGTQAVKVRVVRCANNNGLKSVSESDGKSDTLGGDWLAIRSEQGCVGTGGKAQNNDVGGEGSGWPDATCQRDNNELPDTARDGQKDKKKRKPKSK